MSVIRKLHIWSWVLNLIALLHVYIRKIWKNEIELETISFFGLLLDTRFHLLFLFGSAEFNFSGCFVENFLRMRHPWRHIFKIAVELAPNCYSLLPAKRPGLVILDNVNKENQSISNFKFMYSIQKEHFRKTLTRHCTTLGPIIFGRIDGVVVLTGQGQISYFRIKEVL